MTKFNHAFSIQLLVLFFALMVPDVSAETFVVTRTDDPTPDGCSVGDCSLREAIIAANDDNSENHTIQLTGGLTYTLSISGDVTASGGEIEGEEFDIFSTNDEEGPLKILNADRTIRIESTGGGMAEIDADGTGPVFMILEDTVAELDGLKITGGYSRYGGGFIVAYNENLTITNSLISENNADSGTGTSLEIMPGPGGGGMGIFGGNVILEDSEVSQNESDYNGGGLLIDRAVGYQDASTFEDVVLVESHVTVRRSTVSNNTAERGGAFYVGGASDDSFRNTLNVIASTVSENRAYSTGAGFYTGSGTTIIIDRTTISGNIARGEEGQDRHGAGIAVVGFEDSEDVTEVDIINSTISGNDAGGPGGGIRVDRFGAKTVNIINTTITGNTGSFTTAGGVQAYGGTLNIANSIIANQAEGDDCQISDGGISSGEPLVYTSLGYNLESETTCDFTATGDLQNSDPLLGTLQDNGGSVFTHAITGPLSPAVNNGSNTLYTDAGGDLANDSDANGNDRVYDFASGGIIDIGAFELQQDATVEGCPVTHEDKILFVKKDDNGTGANWADALGELRDALVLFEDETCTTDDVEEIWVTAGTYLPTDDSGDREATFLMPGVNIYGGFEGNETNESQRDLESNISILSGEINNNDNLTGNSYHVVTSIDEASGVLFDFTITGGNASGSDPNDKGGGLYASNGGISMSNVLFENNYAETAGGGAYVIETEDRIGAQHPAFSRTTFRNNESGEDGGGLALEDAESRITSVLFESNNAGRYGGGLYNNGADPVLKNVILKENYADLEGGGIINSNSSPKLFNVLVIDNDAQVNGGGIVNAINASPVLTNVTISGNESELSNGGGIYNRNGATPTLLNSIVWGNTAAGTGNEIWNASNSTAELNFSLYGNGTGDIVEGNGFTATNSLTSNPLFDEAGDPDGSDNIFGTSDDGFALQSSSPAINTGDPDTQMNNFIMLAGYDEIDLAKNPRVFDGDVDIIDMGAYEFQGNVAPPSSCPATDGILFVKKGESGTGSGWGDALGELRDALSLFDSEDCTTDDVNEIWVAEGIYIPGTDPLDTFQLINDVKIYGGFAGTENSLGERDWMANPTILSGDIDGDDDPFDPDSDSDSDTDTPSQTDHLIGVNSYQVVTGSGTDNSAVLNGFTITGGKGNGSAPQDTGGGIYNVSGSPAMMNLTLIGNRALLYGGGIYNENSSPTLANVTLNGNSADFGGGIYNEESSSPTLANVIISDNNADYGGGMLNWESNPTLTNVTFSGNSAGINGGGMINDNSSPTLTNTIIWGNTASGEGNEIYNNGSSSIDLDYSLFRDRDGESDIVEGGGFTAGNSLTGDPQFTNPGSGDYTLQGVSPAINGGDPGTDLSQFPGGPADPLDLAGNPRVYDGDTDIIDIGAYEFQGEPTEEPGFAPFITTWEVESEDLEITIPTAAGQTYNYDVDWGDGNSDTGLTGDANHTYGSADTYTVKITGTFPQIEFFNADDREKIMSVEQWGDIEWESMRKAFQGATNLVINATDTPDLGNATSMLEMFSGATSVNGGLENWDVSTITSMFGVFDGATSFNGDISGWNVSAATDMIRMFAGATAFNRDIGDWVVDNVNVMESMFDGATSFNRDLGDWNTGNVGGMGWVFHDASSFNQDLGGWDIADVSSMTEMLDGSGLSTENYDNTLIGWAAQTVQSEVDLGADGLEYCTGQTARQTLSNEFEWTITGDGPSSGCDPFELLLTGDPGFRMLSSPVEVSLADLLGPIWTQGASGGADHTGGDANVWTWNNSVGGEDPADWIEVTDLSTMVTAGTGVLVYVFDEDEYGDPGSAVWPKTLSVSGTVNSLPLTLTDPEMNNIAEGWTLLGNPVGTGIDWDEFILTDVEGTVYVWDPAAGNYVFWNGETGDLTSGIIHPFQGFFVQTSDVADPSPSLEIPTGAATSPDDFFGKEDVEEPLVVRLHLTGEDSLQSTAWLQFSGQGSLSRNSTDAVKLQPLSADYAALALEPFSDDESSLLALKHLPLELGTPLELPLMATATRGGEFTLAATDINLPDGWSLSIRDTQTGKKVSVEQGMEYTFELETNEELRKIPPYQGGTEGGAHLTPRPLVRSSAPAKDIGTDGSQTRFLLTITPAGAIEADLPDQITLAQNYPNPFNPSTVISYQLPAISQVRLEVYDMVGRRVATLVDGQVPAGAHQVNFDASRLSSGIYLYRLQTADAVFTKKLTLIK